MKQNKMRYKITIDRIKLVNTSSENRASRFQDFPNYVYSADIYFQQRNIVETDFVSSNDIRNEVEFDTSFEIDTNLQWGYLELRIYYTAWDDVNQK